MFLAIINDAYAEVKAEIAARDFDPYNMGDYFFNGYINLLQKLGQRDQIMDIENALRLSGADDGIATYEEIRQNLKK